jgi:hypothetical protein
MARTAKMNAAMHAPGGIDAFLATGHPERPRGCRPAACPRSFQPRQAPETGTRASQRAASATVAVCVLSPISARKECEQVGPEPTESLPAVGSVFVGPVRNEHPDRHTDEAQADEPEKHRWPELRVAKSDNADRDEERLHSVSIESITPAETSCEGSSGLCGSGNAAVLLDHRPVNGRFPRRPPTSRRQQSGSQSTRRE